MYVATCDLLELEVPCDIRRDQNICQFTIRHQKFRHQVDVPIVHASVFLPWLFSLVVVAMLFEELLRLALWPKCFRLAVRTDSIFTEADSLILVNGSFEGSQTIHLPPIMIIPIDVEYFFALHAHNSGSEISCTSVPSRLAEYTLIIHIPSSLIDSSQLQLVVIGEGVYPPVPSTTTSYSGAISSIAGSRYSLKQW